MRGYERDEEDDEEIDIGKFLLVYVSYAFLMSISVRDVWERERLRWKKGLANNNLERSPLLLMRHSKKINMRRIVYIFIILMRKAIYR